MSNDALNWAFGLRLPSAAKFVLLALADRADGTGHCWPGTRDLTRRTCMSARRVLATLGALEAAGAVTITRGGPRYPNRYQLAVGRTLATLSASGRNTALTVRKRSATGVGNRTLKQPTDNHQSTAPTSSGAPRGACDAGSDNQPVGDWPTATMIAWACKRDIDPAYATEILLSNEYLPADPGCRKRFTDRWYALATASQEGYDDRALDKLNDHVDDCESK